jgi:hypothetical protein
MPLGTFYAIAECSIFVVRKNGAAVDPFSSSGSCALCDSVAVVEKRGMLLFFYSTAQHPRDRVSWWLVQRNRSECVDCTVVLFVVCVWLQKVGTKPERPVREVQLQG